MILSDRDIKKEVKAGRLVIRPFSLSQVQPASYDITLDNEIRFFRNASLPFLDVKKDYKDATETIKIKKGEPFIVHPGEFILSTTVEYVELPDDILIQINGRSSIGRLGIIVHATAGFVDPGFRGQLTLEMTNVNNLPVALYPGMRIGQFCFARLESSAENPYGKNRKSKYSGQKGPTESMIWKDFKK